MKLLDNVIKIFRQANILIPVTSIVDIQRLGKIVNKRPVLVSFSGYMWKANILSNAKKLRDLNVYVSNDMSKEEQLEHKDLRTCLHDLKANGKKAHIKEKRINIDEKSYTLFEAKEFIKAQIVETTEKLQDPKMNQLSQSNSATPRKRPLSMIDQEGGPTKDKKI